jgi:hypothetical protein
VSFTVPARSPSRGREAKAGGVTSAITVTGAESSGDGVAPVGEAEVLVGDTDVPVVVPVGGAVVVLVGDAVVLVGDDVRLVADDVVEDVVTGPVTWTAA